MHEIILCKLGEVVLKGLNRRSFEMKLMSNIRRRTQRFGGVCFVAMGLVLVALGFLGPALTREAAVAVLLAVVLLPCVAMYVYSYLLWRRRAAR